MGRVLAPAGRAVFVVGENTVRGVFVRNARILERVAAEAVWRVSRRRSATSRRADGTCRRPQAPGDRRLWREGCGARWS